MDVDVKYSLNDMWDKITHCFQQTEHNSTENFRQKAWNYLINVLEKDNTKAWIQKNESLSNAEIEKCKMLIEKIRYRIPLGRIIKKRFFWKDEFIVSPYTLEPRQETEALIEESLSLNPKIILDIGTGTGCIILSLLKEHNAKGVGVDISPFVLETAKANAKKLNMKCEFSLTLPNNTFDLIVSNPPYVQTEVDYATKFDPITAVFHENPTIITKNLPLSKDGVFLCEVPQYLKHEYENCFKKNYTWHKSSHQEILIFKYINKI